ncbi:MAG: 50S ribosomal protein L24 [Candidatus Nealsonbacteria bacterium CG10_big_fil_rev_8_21_14_0_10_36_24]|uniref:Large ribosomal subunit protein uL24 n=2 Tax=Candidatus Nealsoniibacteriota TaxID=1817911 RepID=A0A2H0YR26_9BACT|nr:MAG: 50S ribosomal protein L24 [Candidatus Nealsonbacteria bacterium CG10_big_fil_rev_8_21_14_0_10_36_24]PIS40203.1 MAG: 50S ribosomal protein L24 [Candidatus Nealsonbacteria bacterium CG08_land_8_20_14_0_20_36_22]
MKIKKGDIVLIISGKDKSRRGKVIKVLPKERRIVVEGINLRKKHIKPKRSGEKGQIIEVPVSLDISNAKFICQKCKKATRLGYKIEGKKKYRICKKCKQEI